MTCRGEDDSMADRVLLVDDDRGFLEALVKRLSRRGLQVTGTSSPEEALRSVSSEKFDAVILDLKMPGMDGIEVLRQMKLKQPELPVILYTGFGSVESSITAMRYGAMDFIEKPADINVLMDKIRKARGRKILKTD